MPETNRGVVYEWLRHDKKFPHVWCPGCGLGVLLGSLVRAFAASGLGKDEVVLISGIGCSGRLPVYVDVGSIHTTHGRALTFATGIKLANPALTVVTVMGDGDATAIGGNHLIHAARRNLDIMSVIVNNQTFGMTGGQFSPTTPQGAIATTAWYGQIEPNFDISGLCAAAGATFVARTTVLHVDQMDRLLLQAMTRSGFSIVEVLSPCYTNFGRQNRAASPVEMMMDFRKAAVPADRWNALTEDQRSGHFAVGVLVERELPRYLDSYRRVCEIASATRSEGEE
jgi:2-oxoglutarate/2-oxoacid ferredoxin oxidoreductase subunit beta